MLPQEAAQRFVILAAPRTGSNMLCTLLNSHDDILCHHELFNPAGIFYALELRDSSFSLGSMEERERDPLALLERAWRTPLGHGWVGFKMTHRQNERVFDAVLADRGVQKIILRRKNRIKTFVSWSISDKLGQWEVYQGEELVRERPRITVDVAALDASITANETYYQDLEHALEESQQSYLRVSYEDLFGEPEHARILDFLGVMNKNGGQRVPLRVRSVKQNSNNLRDLIANFDELERALANTELERELYALDG